MQPIGEFVLNFESALIPTPAEISGSTREAADAATESSNERHERKIGFAFMYIDIYTRACVYAVARSFLICRDARAERECKCVTLRIRRYARARVQKGIPRVYSVQTFDVDAAAILYARACGVSVIGN